MRIKHFMVIAPLCWGILFFASHCIRANPDEDEVTGENVVIALPSPRLDGEMSVEEAIFNRKAVRQFAGGALSKSDIAQLLWAGGGKTVDGVSGATRSYPSAGGLYPLELYLVVDSVNGIAPGIYHYDWENHAVTTVRVGRYLEEVKSATYSSSFKNGPVPACIVATAVYSRTIAKYGERGEDRYVPMDMGGCGENIFLQAQALDLGTYIIGAFNGASLRKTLEITEDETPLYVMPVGKR